MLLAGTGLLGRFAYLILTQFFVVGFGVGYWIVTAKLVSAHQIGLAAAAVSAAAFLSAVGILGVGSLLLVELNNVAEDERRTVLITGVVVSAAASALVTVLAWAVARVAFPGLGGSLGHLTHSPVSGALVVAGTAFTTVGAVVDAASIALRRSRVQLVRNVIAAALRMALVIVLVALGVRTAAGLLLAWTVSLAVSIMVCTPWLTPPSTQGRLGLAAIRATVRRFRASALRHHLLNLAITSVSFFLPLFAAVLLVPRQYAYFAVAQLISSTVMLIPALLAVSLFAEAAGDAISLRRHIRRTLPIAFGSAGLVLLVLEPAAGTVLQVFGPEYAHGGTTILRLLLLGGVSYIVKDHYVAIRRAQGRLSDAARVVALTTAAEAAMSAAGGAWFGVNGLCLFWVFATVAEAAVFAPVVWQVVAGRDPQPVTERVQIEPREPDLA